MYWNMKKQRVKGAIKTCTLYAPPFFTDFAVDLFLGYNK